MPSNNWGRKTIAIVAIDQPLCRNEYGDAFTSPTGSCQAILGTTGTRKCYRTAGTCQDSAHYNPGTLTLLFSRQHDGIAQYGYVIPSMISYSTAPGAINLGGMDDSASALGVREKLTVRFEDHRHSDLLVDPYRLERISGAASGVSPPETYNPRERGTFWGKWLARNPYYSNYTLRLYEGYLGDALADMRVRSYIVTMIAGPDDAGNVTLTAKDIFSRIEEDKAVAPKASRGRLAGSISGSPDGTFTITPSDIADDDYPAEAGSPSELYVAIGDEILRCSRSGATFTILQRACFGTEQKDHDQEDLVQWVLRYSARSPQDIVYDLFCNYTSLGRTGSPSGSDYIDKTAWDRAASQITDVFTGIIAQPTSVGKLIGELEVQAAFTVWPDVESNMVQFRALRAGVSIATIDDDAYIVSGSLSVKPKPDNRVSQAWVFYGQRSPLEGDEDETNYRSRYVSPDLASEGSTQYGTPVIHKVFSRWIAQFGRTTAIKTGDRLLAMFRDPPTEAQFALHASRSDEVALGNYVDLETDLVQDETGAPASVQHAIVEIERAEEQMRLRTRSVVFFDEDTVGDERLIYVESDNLNINLRTAHDLVYTAPVGGSPTQRVRFIVEKGVTVGSVSSQLPAMERGTWPSGVQVTLENHGVIVGAGGVPGRGGEQVNSYNGYAGNPGGTALDTTSGAIIIDNSDGEIAGGGGGGGGGAAAAQIFVGRHRASGGGGGGGGAGTEAGPGALGGATFGSGFGEVFPGGTGSPGTAEDGGAGAAAGSTGCTGGTGGAGGDLGLPGSAGGSPVVPGNQANGSGGVGGAAGKYIDGIANVTWSGSPVGDLRGNVA